MSFIDRLDGLAGVKAENYLSNKKPVDTEENNFGERPDILAAADQWNKETFFNPESSVNYRQIPYAGNFLGHASDAATEGVADTLKFIGDPGDIGTNLHNAVERNSDQYGQTMSLTDPNITLFDYLTDPNGLASGAGDLVGSMLPMLATGAGIAGVAGKAASALGKGTKLANILANSPKITTALNSTPAKWAGRMAASAPTEGMVEGGSKMFDLELQGMPPEEARSKGYEVAAKNIPGLMVTNATEGLLGGKVLSNIMKGIGGDGIGAMRNMAASVPALGVNKLVNAYEEGMQEGISRSVENDKPYSYNPMHWFSDPELKEQKEAALHGFVDTAPLDLLGLTGSAYAGRRGNKPAIDATYNGAQLPGADLQPEVPEIDTNAYTESTNKWLGEKMPSGENGCVEAVVRIGAEYNPFLAKMRDEGEAYVPNLIKKAEEDGIPVIPFDESQLETGDVIVYDGDEHVVTYDGNGGYVGNSSSQRQIVHGDNYAEMGGRRATGIIKTSTNGSYAGGGSVNLGGTDEADSLLNGNNDEIFNNDGEVSQEDAMGEFADFARNVSSNSDIVNLADNMFDSNGKFDTARTEELQQTIQSNGDLAELYNIFAAQQQTAKKEEQNIPSQQPVNTVQRETADKAQPGPQIDTYKPKFVGKLRKEVANQYAGDETSRGILPALAAENDIILSKTKKKKLAKGDKKTIGEVLDLLDKKGVQLYEAQDNNQNSETQTTENSNTENQVRNTKPEQAEQEKEVVPEQQLANNGQPKVAGQQAKAQSGLLSGVDAMLGRMPQSSIEAILGRVPQLDSNISNAATQKAVAAFDEQKNRDSSALPMQASQGDSIPAASQQASIDSKNTTKQQKNTIKSQGGVSEKQETKAAKSEAKRKPALNIKVPDHLSDDGLHGFTDGKKPKVAGTIKKTLGRKFNYGSPYGIMTRAEYVERTVIADHTHVPESVKRKGKTEYRLRDATQEGNVFYDATKAEYEYGEYLLSLPENTSTETKKAADESGKIVVTGMKEKVFDDADTTNDLAEAFGFDTKELNAKGKKKQGKTVKVADVYAKMAEEAEADLNDIVAELKHELNKISANPVFNPKLYELGLKAGLALLKKGYSQFAPWAEHMTKLIGDKIEPWLASIWQGVTNAPATDSYSPQRMRAVIGKTGAFYEEGAHTLEDIQDRFKDMLGDNYGQVEAYIPTSFNSVNAYFNPEAYMIELTQEGGVEHVNDSTERVAQGIGRGTDSDNLGRHDEGGRTSDSERQNISPSGEEVRPFGSIRVRDSGTSDSGVRRDSEVQGDSADAGRTGDSGRGGSTVHSRSRSSSDNGAGVENAVQSVKNRREHEGNSQVNNESKEAGSREKSIAADLPMLLPAQRGDVLKAEKRFFDDEKSGMLFTNGTGTGKTYTGMGIIKRFVNDGKTNILVVAPSDGVIKQWVDTARDAFDIKMNRLAGVQDAGESVCVTTYAAFGDNDAVVKRGWDLVIMDESQNLMDNATGKPTNALGRLRAITYHSEGRYNRFDALNRKDVVREHELRETLKSLRLQAVSDENYKTEYEAAEKELDNLQEKLGKLRKDAFAEWESIPKEEMPKVTMLSATPFSYIKSIDYGEGYLFDFDRSRDTAYSGQYNYANGREKFYMDHFGYRMRNNKLTSPDRDVNMSIVEMEFNEWLKSTGAASGRGIDIDADYERGFMLTENTVGDMLSKGFEDLLAPQYQHLYSELVAQKAMDKRNLKYVLEYIKAKEAVPIIRQYLKAGKKVVVYHQSMKGQPIRNPFKLLDTDRAARKEAQAEYSNFMASHPELFSGMFESLLSPRTVLAREFKGLLGMYNGDAASKRKIPDPANENGEKIQARLAAIQDFNNDKGKTKVMLVQQDAGNAGISMHDTTGKYQRVLIQLSMPARPTFATQIEGRIYRVGSASNAIFRYLTTGTNLERSMFAETIANRSATAENLALGHEARGLRDSFRDAYAEIDDGTWVKNRPNSPTEGVGGKEKDKATVLESDDFTRAKSFYFANAKKTAANKSREGTDYYATPEPLGLKMVEWSGVKDGESILEPSAGHGAISRWFPANTKQVIIEPSHHLAPQAKLYTPDAELVNSYFEDYNTWHKFDAIVMNPPFGQGGKTAIEHLAKAFKHLHDGGRIVAIIPNGPSCQKHFDKWYESDEAKQAYTAKEIVLPKVTFSRAGTNVGCKVMIIDKYPAKGEYEKPYASKVEISNAENINEFFDSIEYMRAPDRVQPINDTQVQNSETNDDSDNNHNVNNGIGVDAKTVKIDMYTHTKTGEQIPFAKVLKYSEDLKDFINRESRSNGGYYSRYAKGYLFKTKEARDKFAEVVGARIAKDTTQYSASDVADDARTAAAVEAEVRDALPNAKDIIFDDNGEAMVEMPNGVNVRVMLRDDIIVNDGEVAAARGAHGLRGDITIEGYWEKASGQNIDGVLAVSGRSRKGTAYHETMHMAMDLTLTAKEKADLYKYYNKQATKSGKNIDEAIADGFRDWKLADKQGSTSTFGKLWRKLNECLERLSAYFHGREYHGDIFGRVAKGEVWERDASGTDAATRQYSAKVAEREEEAQEEADNIIARGLNRVADKLSKTPDERIKIIKEPKDKNHIGLMGNIIVSPGRIAEKIPQFKAFFTAADKAMAKQLKLRSLWNRRLDRAITEVLVVETDKNTGRKTKEIHKLTKEERADLFDLLRLGDVKGEEYTKDAIINELGYNEYVAKAYIHVRNLMNTVYENLNEARCKIQTYTKHVNAAVLEDMRKDKFIEVIFAKEDAPGEYLVTYKEKPSYQKHYDAIPESAYNLMAHDDAIQIIGAAKTVGKDENGETLYEVNLKEAMPDIHKIRGYIPHYFHEYMVRNVLHDSEGKEYYEVIGSGRTLKDAQKVAEDWLKENPDAADAEKIVIVPKSFNFGALGMDMSNNVVIGDKDYFKMQQKLQKENEMTLQESKELMDDIVKKKPRHRFLGSFLHRKGVKNYEKDMEWVLRHYVNTSARYIGLETEFKPQSISLFERYFGSYDKEYSGLPKYIKDYIGDINGNPTWAEKWLTNKIKDRNSIWGGIFRLIISGLNAMGGNYGDRFALQLTGQINNLMSIAKLGFLNVSSAMINFTQLANTAAYIGDPAAVVKAFVKGVQRKYSLHDMRILEESGVLFDLGLDSGAGYNQMSLNGALGKSLVLFKTSEAIVRRGTIICAYEKGRKEGMSHTAALAYAREINRKANFEYGVHDAPNVFRRGSIFAQLMLQFKKYSVKELEVMHDMAPIFGKETTAKQKAIFWGMYILLGGLFQVPFSDFLDEAFFDGAGKLKIKKAIMELTEGNKAMEKIASVAMYGAGAALINADVSRRVGLGDVLPTEFKDMTGPLASTVYQMQDYARQGDGVGTLRSFSPSLGNIYAAFAGESTGKRDRVNSYYNTLHDRVLKGMGFRSMDESLESDQSRIASIYRDEKTKEEQEAIDDYIANPTTKNAMRLKKLGITKKRLEEEKKKKKMDRKERTKANMSKKNQKKLEKMLRFGN